MLLLTTLFVVVSGIFVYALRPDKGRHTKHARNSNSADLKATESSKLAPQANRSTAMHYPAVDTNDSKALNESKVSSAPTGQSPARAAQVI